MTLGEKIKAIRNEHNLDQKEFGKIFNVEFSTISRWEADDNIPNIYIVLDIIRHFNIDYYEFFEDLNKKQ